MILSRKEILKAVKQGRVGITPFDEKNVGACSVDMHLGKRFKVFRKTREKLEIKGEVPGIEYSTLFKNVEVNDGDGLLLHPGELVLGVTEEKIRLNDEFCARIDGRSRFARLGLLVHVSSSLIQPGCDNVQVLEIMNMSPWKIVLFPGTKVCQLVFEELKGKARYGGEFKNQREP
ncbi:dCTP deaminase [Candidatus Micrarchaeota archaeon]|nr:dCTP deaminase [Candidatus Micrarchaeota archaeon]